MDLIMGLLARFPKDEPLPTVRAEPGRKLRNFLVQYSNSAKAFSQLRYNDRQDNKPEHFVGNGAYNIVFARNDSTAVRVSMRHNNPDPSWDYIEHVYELGSASLWWMPVVYWVGTVNGRRVALVERLMWCASDAPYNIYNDCAVTAAKHEALTYLMEHFPDCNEDLHSGNIMMRADGSVVITDPLC